MIVGETVEVVSGGVVFEVVSLGVASVEAGVFAGVRASSGVVIGASVGPVDSLEVTTKKTPVKPRFIALLNIYEKKVKFN